MSMNKFSKNVLIKFGYLPKLLLSNYIINNILFKFYNKFIKYMNLLSYCRTDSLNIKKYLTKDVKMTIKL